MRRDENLNDALELQRRGAAAVASSAEQEGQPAPLVHRSKEKERMKELKGEIMLAQQEYKAARDRLTLLKRQYRLLCQDRLEPALVDWEKNKGRVRAMRELLQTARITQAELARYVGVSPGHLNKVLSAMGSRLGMKLEKRLRQGVTDLVEHRRIQTNLKRAEQEKGHG